MKIFSKIIFLILLSSIFSVTNAYNWNYVCKPINNSNCYETETKNIDLETTSGYYMTNVEVRNVSNFTQYIKNILQKEYGDYYGGKEESFLTGDSIKNASGQTIKQQVTYTFINLLNNGTPIKIEDITYGSGLEYILTNFSSVIGKYNSGYPYSKPSNNITGIDKNIISYDTAAKEFTLKNVCDTPECNSSQKKTVSYNSTSRVYLLSGEVKSIKPNFRNEVTTIKIEDSSLSSYTIRAGEPVNFKVSFDVMLNNSNSYTEYIYKIFYRYGSSGEKIELFKENIKIHNQTKEILVKNHEENSNVWDTLEEAKMQNILETSPANSNIYGNKTKITINEGMFFEKAGKVRFEMELKNVTEDYDISSSALDVPLTILPSDNVSLSEVTITDFSDEYNIKDTLNLKFTIKDKYGNIHCDNIGSGSGYYISFSQETLNDLSSRNKEGALELSPTSPINRSTQGINVKSNSSVAPCTVNVKLQATQAGVYKVGFNIKVRERDGESSYKSPATYVIAFDDKGEKITKEIIPKQLETKSLFIKTGEDSDMIFKCTNEDIKLLARCDNDFGSSDVSKGHVYFQSGCSNTVTYKGTASYIPVTTPKSGIQINLTEKENNSTGTFIIVDNAYNQRSYNYFMDHIDKTPPTITLKKNGLSININSGTISSKAANFTLELFDATTRTCLDDAKIDYTIKIGGEVVKELSIDKNSLGVEEIRDAGTFGLKYELILDEWLTKTGSYTITITVKDAYGNTTTKTLKFTIYPTDDGLGDLASWVGPNGDGSAMPNGSKFHDLKVIGENKFANNSDYYQYTLTLRDKYGNIILGKSLSSIEQNTDLKPVSTICLDNRNANEICSDTNKSALVLPTGNLSFNNTNGSLTFNVKSLAPGEFSQNFFANIHGWNDSNQDNNSLIRLSFGTAGMKDFKIPLKISSIDISNNNGGDEYNAEPELGKEQLYRIKMDNIGNLTGISDEKLGLSKSSFQILDTSGQRIDSRDWAKFDVKNAGSFSIRNNVISSLSGTLNSKSNNLLSTPRIGTKNLEISYTISSKSVKYYLEDYYRAGTCDDKRTLGVKIIGNLQSDGKAVATGQRGNFSDLTSFNTRTAIRKNATTITTGMTASTSTTIRKVGGVVLYNGDIALSKILLTNNNTLKGIETIVVMNGNLIIDKDITTDLLDTGKLLGIIVIKDSYNVKTDYNKAGNIYVANTIKTINAIIYADGALRSADASGNIYPDSKLLERLELYGSLVSRNTIGGATQAEGTDYLLPGSAKTLDYDLASIYDLNYLRKTPICSADDYAFLIRYNSRVVTNPPKGFSLEQK